MHTVDLGRRVALGRDSTGARPSATFAPAAMSLSGLRAYREQCPSDQIRPKRKVLRLRASPPPRMR